MTQDKKTVLITGFTSGIGHALARHYAQEKWRVIGIARSAVSARQVVDVLRAQTGNSSLHYQIADLARMSEVQAVAKKIAAEHPKLDLLINNAGALFKKRYETAEQIEATLALNFLSPYLLTKELLARLSPEGRVVNVTSAAHVGASCALDALEPCGACYHGWNQYRTTKLLLILWTQHLQQILPQGQSAVSVHPGFTASHFGANNGSLFRLLMGVMKLMASSPDEAARYVVQAAESVEPSLYSNRGRAVAPQLPEGASNLAPALVKWADKRLQSVLFSSARESLTEPSHEKQTAENSREPACEAA